MSKKRQADNRRRRAAVVETFGSRPACQACLPFMLIGIDRVRTGCNGWATDAHELLSRARGGSIVDTANIVPVSRACHDYITTHPDDAEAAGLALPSQDHRRPPFPRALP